MSRDEFTDNLKAFEGYAPHMYLDTVGVVTIGVGLALFSSADAKSFVFINRRTSRMATADEIEAAYNKVKSATKGYSTNYYRDLTDLEASPTMLMIEFDRRLNEAFADAKAFYPNFSSLPSSVQYALVDMAYNLGRAKLYAYKNLKKHLENGDYEAAALESHRRGPHEDRNNTIKYWIKSAAKPQKAVNHGNHSSHTKSK